jgi:hypothetical protein
MATPQEALNAIRQRMLAAMLAACALVAGCAKQPADAPRRRADDESALKADLQKIAGARVLFGHQSVGRDVLGGLTTLSNELQVPLRIVSIDGMPPDDAPGLFHSQIGSNGDPAGKCEVFAGLLTRPERPRYDVAMMKFCYVDLVRDGTVSVKQMMDSYVRTAGLVNEARPDVKLVHVTVPLMADPPGKKTMLKRMLRRPVDGDEDNVLRNSFNDELRRRFANERVFDLATVESSYPNGERSSFKRDGKTVYSLASEYTTDGGHLNAAGQRRAAVELVRTLAAAVAGPASEPG